MSEPKLGKFLQDISNMRWDQFWKAERDQELSTNESIILALIRACASENLQAIKMTLNRLDGKLKTPIKIEYPKFYYLYPNAKVVAVGETMPIEEFNERNNIDITGVNNVTVINVDEPEPLEGEVNELPSLSLRQTLSKMSDYPRSLPEELAIRAQEVEAWLRKDGPEPPEIPMVKSVVAAHLLILAQTRHLDAIEEVFNQIDGKLVETIEILGEDVYMVRYDSIAPAGATLNSDGVYQLIAENSTNQWAVKLGEING